MNERRCVDEKQFEIEALEERLDDLRMANERLREERDNLADTADSLAGELQAVQYQLKVASSVISRLRNHIAQGIEL